MLGGSLPHRPPRAVRPGLCRASGCTLVEEADAVPTTGVMLVEDDEQLTRLLQRLLEPQGYVTAVAASLSEARDVLRHASQGAWPYQVVILDLALPDGDGAELLPELGRLSPVPAVAVVSGNLDSERTLELWGRCCVSMPKPFEQETFLALVHRLARTDQSSDPVDAFCAEHRLSPAQARLVRLAAQGKGTDEAAAALGCASETVATHWKRILSKTGCSSRTSVLAVLLSHSRRSAGA
jgi:DNA-binding NarL/FixJ family response regulator